MTPATPLARALPVLFALLQIATPTLPFLGIGRPIGDQSDAVRTLVTPAGWAFSIWSLLYLGSLVFAVVQALPARRDDPLFAAVRLPAAGAFLGNALWVAYTQVYGLALPSVVIILATLACLIACYRRFARWPRPTTAQRWGAIVPLSALTSWLTVAALVNIAATLRFHGVEGGTAAPTLAAAVLIVGGLIAAAAIVRGRGNLAYAAVFLWALAAIHAAGGQQAGAVAFAAALDAALVISAVALALLRRAEAAADARAATARSGSRSRSPG